MNKKESLKQQIMECEQLGTVINTGIMAARETYNNYMQLNYLAQSQRTTMPDAEHAYPLYEAEIQRVWEELLGYCVARGRNETIIASLNNELNSL